MMEELVQVLKIENTCLNKNCACNTTVQNPCQDEVRCSHSCAAVNGIAQCFCPAGYTLPRPTDTQCVGKHKKLCWEARNSVMCYNIIFRPR